MIEILGIFFTVVIGILLHFTYEWSGRSLLVSFLAPVNESLFEHLKLLVTPYLLWTMAEYVHYGQFADGFIPAKTIGLLAGIFFIVLGSRLCTAITGKNSLPAHIVLFVCSVFLSFFLSWKLMPVTILQSFAAVLLADFCLLALVLLFAIFTVYPPQHPMFRDESKSKS